MQTWRRLCGIHQLRVRAWLRRACFHNPINHSGNPHSRQGVQFFVQWIGCRERVQQLPDRVPSFIVERARLGHFTSEEVKFLCDTIDPPGGKGNFRAFRDVERTGNLCGSFIEGTFLDGDLGK